MGPSESKGACLRVESFCSICVASTGEPDTDILAPKQILLWAIL